MPVVIAPKNARARAKGGFGVRGVESVDRASIELETCAGPMLGMTSLDARNLGGIHARQDEKACTTTRAKEQPDMPTELL
jgi:hypothetical protein